MDIDKLIAEREDLFSSLGISKEWFNGKRVVDIGCGTCLKSICYSKWGADVQALEPSQKSIADSKKNNEELGAKVNFSSLSFWSYIPQQNFDFVACENILEYTFAPLNGIKRASRWLNDNGYLFISIADKESGTGISVRRKILRMFDGSEEEKVKTAKRLFGKYIKKISELLGINEEEFIKDTLISNPYFPLRKTEMESVFSEVGLKIKSSMVKNGKMICLLSKQ